MEAVSTHSLGCRAAEEIVFGDVSTGAQNDLARATDTAKSIIKEYGMSDKLGQVFFSHEKHRQFLDMGCMRRLITAVP